ncbi:ubiquitin-conjugating enzyme/RWD-like protein [Hyaloraphidium curvatum]|nr:ubiquitin-conjugating enzyme/RWD-like protein [Hyaloraphidium curvatum]
MTEAPSPSSADPRIPAPAQSDPPPTADPDPRPDLPASAKGRVRSSQKSCPANSGSFGARRGVGTSIGVAKRTMASKSTTSVPWRPPPRSTWDPDQRPASRAPTKACLSRIRAELKRLKDSPLEGIWIVPDDNMVTTVHALVTGPFDTPYEGGFFHFVLDVPDDYPHFPPAVKLITTDMGRVRFNPNLYADGKVCLSILGTWPGPSWSAAQSLSSVLLSIQSLMGESPLRNEPGLETAPEDRCRDYDAVVRHETVRAAVCGTLEGAPETARMPQAVKEAVRGLFPLYLQGYREACAEGRKRDGEPMVGQSGEVVGKFGWGKIAERIEKLAAEICPEDAKGGK